MRIGSRIFALVATVFLGWASVADNPAVCPDEQTEDGDSGHRHETPPTSHCCLTAPCHTPTALQPLTMTTPSASVLVAQIPVTADVLTSIDARVPPTPPPTALD